MEQEDFMCLALALAEQAEAMDEVPVGCVVVCGGEVVGRGFNLRETQQDALAHAELLAIREACDTLGSWRIPECDLYVTLEPCPMCAGAMVNARIRRVVFGAADPKAGACGSVVDLFSLALNHKPAAEGGVLAEESAALLRRFFARLRKG